MFIKIINIYSCLSRVGLNILYINIQHLYLLCNIHKYVHCIAFTQTHSLLLFVVDCSFFLFSIVFCVVFGDGICILCSRAHVAPTSVNDKAKKNGSKAHVFRDRDRGGDGDELVGYKFTCVGGRIAHLGLCVCVMFVFNVCVCNVCVCNVCM